MKNYNNDGINYFLKIIQIASNNEQEKIIVSPSEIAIEAIDETISLLNENKDINKTLEIINKKGNAIKSAMTINSAKTKEILNIIHMTFNGLQMTLESAEDINKTIQLLICLREAISNATIINQKKNKR